MNICDGQPGYTFNAKELSQIREVLERTHSGTGTSISYAIGESCGFAAAMISIDDGQMNHKEAVVLVQSWRDETGIVAYGVLGAADRKPLDSRQIYNSFLEALVVADVFLRRVIEGLIAKRSSERLAHSKANPLFSGNAIKSNVLSPEQIHYVQSFANDLGKISGLTGFAKFIESKAGVMSIALGVMNKDMPIMLGTVVAVANETGSSCTVRDFQNRPMPGLDSYRTIYSALTSTRPSFEKLSQITAKQLRPSLLQRMFGR
jgi:hypothetical protein